jgi:hypothetical protein
MGIALQPADASKCLVAVDRIVVAQGADGSSFPTPRIDVDASACESRGMLPPAAAQSNGTPVDAPMSRRSSMTAAISGMPVT